MLAPNGHRRKELMNRVTATGRSDVGSAPAPGRKAAWLTGLWSARTRRAYAGDVTLGLTGRGTSVLEAGMHVDLLVCR
jgi:hypothetical protein